MANSLFNTLGPKTNGSLPRDFQKFMQSMKGKDPNAIINEMVSSGKLSQAQLNQIQAQAQQMAGQFDGIKKMFGF